MKWDLNYIYTKINHTNKYILITHKIINRFKIKFMKKNFLIYKISLVMEIVYFIVFHFIYLEEKIFINLMNIYI